MLTLPKVIGESVDIVGVSVVIVGVSVSMIICVSVELGDV